MAREEEQHGCILHACKALIENYEDEDARSRPSAATRPGTEHDGSSSFLSQASGPSLSVEEAFRIALEIESSEIDAIYSKLLHLGGPQIAKTMENLGVPASVQRQKLKVALRRFCSNPELLQAAEASNGATEIISARHNRH